jgi:Mn-dependent DtxR family transcriptional regulator
MAPKPLKRITTKQAQYLLAIHALRKGMHPADPLTVEEVRKYMGKSWRATREAVRQLARKGRVKYDSESIAPVGRLPR